VDFVPKGFSWPAWPTYPKPIDESITQAKAAVARAMTILSKEGIFVGGVVASVNSDKCAACLTCVRTCPYGRSQHRLKKATRSLILRRLAWVRRLRGRVPGQSDCPVESIFTDEQIMAKTGRAVSGGERIKKGNKVSKVQGTRQMNDGHGTRVHRRRGKPKSKRFPCTVRRSP